MIKSLSLWLWQLWKEGTCFLSQLLESTEWAILIFYHKEQSCETTCLWHFSTTTTPQITLVISVSLFVRGKKVIGTCLNVVKTARGSLCSLPVITRCFILTSLTTHIHKAFTHPCTAVMIIIMIIIAISIAYIVFFRVIIHPPATTRSWICY